MKIFLVIFAVQSLASGQGYDVYYKWKKAEFNFPPGNRPNASQIIEKNVPITAFKIYKDRMFITTPRYKDGVPVTLSTVPYSRAYIFGVFWDRKVEGPRLDPFPSYEMNQEFNCTALQMVQSMELDQYGRLWVVDLGRSSILDAVPRNSCPARLVVFDVTKGQKKILFAYTFPPEVASPTQNILKDIQVACTAKDDCWVYISDIANSQLVVYDHKNNQSWVARHPSMAPEDNKANFTIDKAETSVPFGITGLGLAPRNRDFETLYFSPLASDKIYQVNTTVLKSPALRNNSELDPKDVKEFGTKRGQSDGFAMDSQGTLYYGVLPESAVYKTQTGRNINHLQTEVKIAGSNQDLSWPDTFGFDGNGHLLLTSSKFHLWEAGKLNDTDYNYRIIILKRSIFEGGVSPYNS